jgi:hypothetical protein
MSEDTTQSPQNPVSDSGTASESVPEDALAVGVGDVDIADLSKRKRKGESPALILAGYWVRLAAHDDVDDRFVGHIAAVLESPWKSVPFADDDQESAIHGYRYDDTKLFRVQTRDEVNAILEVPYEAFSEVSDSRAGLLNHA